MTLGERSLVTPLDYGGSKKTPKFVIVTTGAPLLENVCVVFTCAPGDNKSAWSGQSSHEDILYLQNVKALADINTD